jgi:hypothetical protein
LPTRSRFITLVHALAKSLTICLWPSAAP